MHRSVESVNWAKECERPRVWQRGRRSTSQVRGIAYERAFAQALKRSLPGVKHGQWFVYHADGLLGYCQTDFIRVTAQVVHVIECKLTNVEEACEQLMDLYFPVLRKAYERPIYGIIATRSLHRTPDLARVTSSLSAALSLSYDRVPVLHWIGRGPL
jgi:hypothetical protein